MFERRYSGCPLVSEDSHRWIQTSSERSPEKAVWLRTRRALLMNGAAMRPEWRDAKAAKPAMAAGDADGSLPEKPVSTQALALIKTMIPRNDR